MYVRARRVCMNWKNVESAHDRKAYIDVMKNGKIPENIVK